MKIKGWDKISGYTYKGMCIVNPIHNADETKYYATILNLNLPQKPKWELSVLTDKHRFKQDNSFNPEEPSIAISFRLQVEFTHCCEFWISPPDVVY